MSLKPEGSSFGAKRLPRNILSGILGQACGLAIAFFATPVLVRCLGASDYGLWNVAMAVGAWVGFVNMICSTSAIRFIGQALGRRDEYQVQEATEALRRWSLILGSLGCLFLVLAAPWLSHHVLQLEPAQRSWAAKVLVLQGIFVLFQVLTAVESAIVTVNQRLDVTQGVRTAGAALQSIGAAAVVLISHGVIAVAWWVAIAQIIEWMAAGFWARRIQPPVALNKPVDLQDWGGRLLEFGAPLITGYFAAQLFLPASRILLGTLRPVAEVAHFAVPLTLAINVKALSTHIASALFPAMTEKAGQKDFSGLKRLYLKGLRWSWLATVPTAGLAIVLGGPFISAWISPDFGRDVAPLMPALVIGVNAYYFSAMPELVAQGMGKPGWWAVFIVISGLSNIVAASFLIPARGAQGAAESLLIAGVVLTVSLLVWMGRNLKINLAEYAEVFDCRVAVVTAVVSGLAAWFVSGRTMALLPIFSLGVGGLLLIALMTPWWLPKEEWAWVKRQWRSRG